MFLAGVEPDEGVQVAREREQEGTGEGSTRDGISVKNSTDEYFSPK